MAVLALSEVRGTWSGLEHVQVSASRPHPTLAVALDKLLTRSLAVVTQGLRHPLQLVRRAVCVLIPVYLATVRSSAPFLPTAPASSNTEAAMRSVLDSTLAAAREALHKANAGAAPASNGNHQGSKADVQACEIAMSSAAAITASMYASGTILPRMQDLLLMGVPWVVEAQGLQHPAMTSTVTLLRSTASGLKNTLLNESHAAQVVHMAVAGLSLPMWQSRGTALAMLQCSWFRCATLRNLNTCSHSRARETVTGSSHAPALRSSSVITPMYDVLQQLLLALRKGPGLCSGRAAAVLAR